MSIIYIYTLCLHLYMSSLETVNTNQIIQWVELYIIDRI